MSEGRDSRRSVFELTGRSGTPLIRLALALALSVILAILIAPPRDDAGPRLSHIDVDSVAERAVVATHDFVFERPDPAGIRAAREDAARNAEQIWDHDATLEAVLDERISNAFKAAREAIAERGRVLVAEQHAASAGSGDPAPEPLPIEALIAEVPDAEREAIAAALPELDALISAARTPEAIALRPFAEDGFSRQSEDALKNLVREAMGKQIVEALDALDDVGDRVVILRTLRDGTPQEERRVRHLRTFGEITRLDDLIAPARHHLFYIDEERLREAIGQAAEALVVVNTRRNARETERRAAAEVAEAEAAYRASLTHQYRAGEVLVDRGEVIEAELVRVVEAMAASAPPARSPITRLLGSWLLIALVVSPVMVFALGNLRRFTHRAKDLAMMSAVLVTQVAVTRLGIFIAALIGAEGALPTRAVHLLLPYAAGAMLVRILTNAENALVYGVLYSLIAGLLFQGDVTFVTAAMLASVVGTVAVREAKTRTDILRAGAIVGVVMSALAVALDLLRHGELLSSTPAIIGGAALGGLVSALFVYALLPIIESSFRYTTSMRLMELANLNHPALKELILKAPGSYHHSIMVGQLVEAACEVVGADALLGRVGSFFHDIGKMKNPQYFAENQQGVNPHDKLKPNMSALVIKAHVKDGVELAKQYKLPSEIVDFIREHHGTSLIQYFYRRAQEQSEGEVNDADYRYPGPKPQSRETAICMLADGIEAASRTLPDPTHAHLKGLVQKMVNKAFIDGQLDECELTLKDLDLIAHAFLLRLTAFYHHRPEYPDARRSQTGRKGRDSGNPPAVDAETDDGPDHPPRGDAAADSDDERTTDEDPAISLRRLDM